MVGVGRTWTSARIQLKTSPSADPLAFAEIRSTQEPRGNPWIILKRGRNR